MFKKTLKTIVRGLVPVLPLAVTLYALWWLSSGAESVFGGPIHTLFPKIYVPGMGIIVGLIVVIGVGVGTRIYIGQRMLAWGNHLVERIPLAKTLYGAMKDLLGLFSGEKKSFSRVVLLTLPGTTARVLGLVTREDFTEIKGYPPDVIAVYMPLSYQMGGFTLFVPRDSVETVEMSVEEALRFAITAGVSGKIAAEGEPAAAASGQ